MKGKTQNVKASVDRIEEEVKVTFAASLHGFFERSHTTRVMFGHAHTRLVIQSHTVMMNIFKKGYLQNKLEHKIAFESFLTS